MVKVTEDEFVEKWSRRLKGATEDIRRGVQKVTEAPSAKAIARKDKFVRELTAAIEAGIWEKQLEKYGLADWQRDMTEKGVPRISRGVDAAQKKMKDFASWLLSRVEAGQRLIEEMPDETLEDRIARIEKFIRHMAEERYKAK